MASIASSLLSLHVLILLCAAQKHAGALTFEWLGAGDANFSYEGDASVYGPREVKLTIGVADAVFHASAGSMRYAHPISLCSRSSHAQSFLTSFTFRMSALVSSSAFRGDGVAFFISPVGALPSPPLPTTKGLFGGLFGNSSSAAAHRPTKGRKAGAAATIFAVEFDSAQESWDPDDNHVGADLGSVVSSRTASLNASGIALRSGRAIAARIKYDGRQDKLDVHAAYSDGQQSAGPILSVQPLRLCRALRGRPAIVGFSSASRGSAETHDLLSWAWRSS